MGADIVEHEDVPEVCERGGLFYFCRGGRRIKAYRPQSLLLLKHRIDAAYREWDKNIRAEVIPACSACEKRSP